MLRRIGRIVLFTCCIILPMVAKSMDFSNIYDALMRVPNETQKARLKASAIGLGNVFVRVSGRDDIQSNAVIRNAVDHPEQYIEKFRYVRRLNDVGEPETLLQLTYSKQAIIDALKKAKLPVWDENRPLVLLILKDDTPDKNLLISEFEKASFHRGLPFVMPREDASVQGDDDLKRWIGYANVDQVLSGDITTTESGKLQANWILANQQAQHHWTDQAENTKALFAHAVDHVVTLQTQLEKPDGEKPALAQSFKIEVLNISGLKSYADVVSYLRQIPGVKHIKVEDVNPSAVIFTLYVPGGKDAFVKALANIDQLKTVDEPGVNFSEYLRLEWLGSDGTISTEYPSTG